MRYRQLDDLGSRAEPGTGTIFASDFNVAVSSPVMGGLFGDAGAIDSATLAGDVARVGTPRTATAGGDIPAGRAQGMGPGDQATGTQQVGATSGVHPDGLAGGAVMAPARRARSLRRRGQRGFTLLELLITLSVTTIGLIGLLALHVSIARGNDGASRVAEAEQITVTALESLRAQSSATLMQTLAGSTAAIPPATAAAYTVLGRNGLPYSVTRSVTALNATSASLWLIRVVTSWGEDGAAIGSAGDPLHHQIALEVIRTIEEQL
jgi:prepilin-type N-terminal cleavage/methylation domain-containing protein